MNSKASDAAPQITVSVVTHRQNSLVNQLLEDIGRVCAGHVKVVVTENVPDATPVSTAFPSELIRNPAVKGFGANHNAAFGLCRTPYFCVVNPDIRLFENPFPALLEALQRPRAAIAGPLVRDPGGRLEDSARRFPTLGSLCRKILRPRRGPDYLDLTKPIEVDWVAGMFMLFKSEAFQAVGGFDERYFLYYEDVDICRRLLQTGRRVIYQPGAEAIHDAQRASRRDLAHLRWHLQSMLRFLTRA